MSLSVYLVAQRRDSLRSGLKASIESQRAGESQPSKLLASSNRTSDAAPIAARRRSKFVVRYSVQMTPDFDIYTQHINFDGLASYLQSRRGRIVVDQYRSHASVNPERLSRPYTMPIRASIGFLSIFLSRLFAAA